MENPGTLMEEAMADTAENLRLKAHVNELSRKLSTAQTLMQEMDQRHKAVIGERNRLVEQNGRYAGLLNSLQTVLWFRFMPKGLKTAVRGEFSSAD